jgi:hypothetical protein
LFWLSQNRDLPGIAILADSAKPQPEVVAPLIVKLLNRLLSCQWLNAPADNDCRMIPKTLVINVHNIPSTSGSTQTDFLPFNKTQIGVASLVDFATDGRTGGIPFEL